MDRRPEMMNRTLAIYATVLGSRPPEKPQTLRPTVRPSVRGMAAGHCYTPSAYAHPTPPHCNDSSIVTKSSLADTANFVQIHFALILGRYFIGEGNLHC